MPALPPADLEYILVHTRELWEPMRGRSIFVTGGTGFFGRWLLESFAYIDERLDLGAHLTALTRHPEAIAEKAPHLAAAESIRFVRGDIRELKPMALQFPYMIHAATESGTTLGADDPLGMFDVIVNGTRAALEFAAASGTRRFLFTSSGAVYGRQPAELTHLPETYGGAPDCREPANAYGEGKRAAELLCACYRACHPGLEPVIARCFAFVGPLLPLDAHFAIGNFIRDGLRGGPIQIGGDGTPYRSYLYAADLAIWLWTLLFKGEPNAPYNVGSEAGVSILELAQAVNDCFTVPPEITVARKPVPGALPSRYVPAVGRALTQLGVSPGLDLKEAITRTIAFNSSPAR